MKLRFVWHVVQKDVRRLWWVIALTLALLARLVHFDSMRVFATAGSDEGWLNILLPLAWSLLIALAVLEDPVVGDTPFWATVPCRWTSLAAAKAVLIACVIHLPYLLAGVWVLVSRGFSPMASLPDLLYRQLAVLALTLASLALATLVRNVTQFMVIAVALATMVTAPSMGLDRDSVEIHHIRELLAFPVVAMAACWISLMQYASRRTSAARLAGIAAISIAAIIWWLPQERFGGIQASMSAAPSGASVPSVRLATGVERPEDMRANSLSLQFGRASVAIPIVMTGLRDNIHLRFTQAAPMFMDGADNRYPAQRTSLQRAPSQQAALSCCINRIPWWQILAIEPVGYERIKNLPVSLHDSLAIDYYRPTPAARASIGKSIVIADDIRCSVDVPIRDNPSDEGLRVECESPNPLPAVQVKVSDGGGREWEQYVGSSHTVMSYPTGAWLSPVYRVETTFPLTDEEHYKPLGAHWMLPREIVQSVRISVIAELPEGSRIVPYSIPNLMLSQFVVKQ